MRRDDRACRNAAQIKAALGVHPDARQRDLLVATERHIVVAAPRVGTVRRRAGVSTLVGPLDHFSISTATEIGTETPSAPRLSGSVRWRNRVHGRHVEHSPDGQDVGTLGTSGRVNTTVHGSGFDDPDLGVGYADFRPAATRSM